jgi:ERCC4-type nuclease
MAETSKLSTIIVDTREQKPLWKNKIIRRKLDFGDYTTENLEGKFHIERKSLQDLYGTIIQGHRRFVNEILRAKIAKARLHVYVDGTEKNFLAKKFPGGHTRKVKGSTLSAILKTMVKKYGFELVWCGSRDKSKKMMVQKFTELENGKKQKSNN